MVLGAETLNYQSYPTFADAPCGTYGILEFNKFSDSPIQNGDSGILIKSKMGGYYSYLAIDVQDGLMYRMFSHDSVWHLFVPDYIGNYSTLASLASALGATTHINADFDDLTPGVYQWFQAETESYHNRPFANGIIIVSGYGNYMLQTAYSYDGNECKNRVKWNTWTAWKSITLT